MATIKDIAKKAGVSISTVSRILSYDSSLSVTAQTRQRVLEAAEALQYTRKSKKIKSKTNLKIGVIQWQKIDQQINELYYLQIQYGVENKANHLNIATEALSLADLWRLKKPDYNGLILIGKFDGSEIKMLEKLKLPLVFVDQNVLSYGFDSVCSDYETPIRTIIDFYLQHQVQDIGLLIGEEETSKEHFKLQDPRWQTFRQYLSELNLFSPDYVFKGHYTPESGFELMRSAITKLGPRLPHGFIVGSDAMAVGALKALSQAGISVPDRVNVVSFDDVSIAKFTTPALSTIHSETELMGQQAVDLLFDRIRHPKKVPQTVTFATTFMRRESSF